MIDLSSLSELLSKSQDPWQRIAGRIHCLRNDPACQIPVLVHAGLLSLIFFLAFVSKYIAPIKGRKRIFISSAATESDVPRETSVEVHRIIVYPIKSCAGVDLTTAIVGRKGLELDRRWMVLRKSKKDAEKWEKLSLREEKRLTLVIPRIQEATLHLSISTSAEQQDEPLPSIEIPLQADSIWDTLPSIEMWGDEAGGKIVELTNPDQSKWKQSPSEWFSQFLGYPALLVQFDTQGPQRNAFPLYKPPSLPVGSPEWTELRQPRGIEFQDEYPLLIATVESLNDLQGQIKDAVFCSDPETSDGRGGPKIGGKLLQRDVWKERITAVQEGQDDWLDILRFRPNIIVKGRSTASLTPWEEDDWTTLSLGSAVKVHLSAQCERCLLTTVDPQSATQDLAVPLAFLRRNRNKVKEVPLGEDGMPIKGEGKKGPCFGIYGIIPTDGEGEIRIGDHGTAIGAT